MIELKNLRGSFLTEGAADRLFIGYNNPNGPDKLYGFPIATLNQHAQNGQPLGPSESVQTLDLPNNPQGADSNGGKLWVSSSTRTSKPTWCAQLKRGSTVYPFGPGSEEIEFEVDGSVWGAFEAGAKTFETGGPFFPVIARFDSKELVTGGGCGS